VTEPWDDPRITAFGMLLEAHAAALTQVGRDLEASAGIPVSWFEVLLRLARSPEQRLRMAELARQVGLSTSGLTRLVDRIEAAGYLTRQACPTDRRGAEAVLTDEGAALLQSAVPAHVASIDANFAAPLGENLPTLEALLRLVRDHAGPGACPSDSSPSA
jgi:MarR family transcriptional regulator, 2-MHQ and catechol-resistance regulon repressor